MYQLIITFHGERKHLLNTFPTLMKKKSRHGVWRMLETNVKTNHGGSSSCCLNVFRKWLDSRVVTRHNNVTFLGTLPWLARFEQNVTYQEEAKSIWPECRRCYRATSYYCRASGTAWWGRRESPNRPHRRTSVAAQESWSHCPCSKCLTHCWLFLFYFISTLHSLKLMQRWYFDSTPSQHFRSRLTWCLISNVWEPARGTLAESFPWRPLMSW